MKILLTGSRGFVGTNLTQRFLYENYLEEEVSIATASSTAYDLTIRDDVLSYYQDSLRVDVDDKNVVINLAANVGGIGYNERNPYDLYYDNLLINAFMIDEAGHWDIDRFVQVGTVCSYPKVPALPFSEKTIWDGYPEETNAPYGIAKKAALVQLEAAHQMYGLRYIYVIPTNMYGPEDNFNLHNSHVIPALIRKMVEAKEQNKKEVEIWGTGNATRDFLFVDDFVDFIYSALLEKGVPPNLTLNLGSGKDISIYNLAHTIKEIIGFEGVLKFNTEKPDGQPTRVLDISIANSLGWRPKTKLEVGIKKTVDWYLENRTEVND